MTGGSQLPSKPRLDNTRIVALCIQCLRHNCPCLSKYKGDKNLIREVGDSRKFVRDKGDLGSVPPLSLVNRNLFIPDR